MPAGIKTISIPVFDNETFRRGLEVQLTEAVQREVHTRTDLRVAETDTADTILVGTITEVRQPVVVEDERDNVSEQQVFVRVTLEWRDLRTDEIIYAVEGLTASDQFVIPLGENLDLALARAFDKMAERIVNEMENRNW